MIVSFNVSPFEELVTLGSVNPMTRAPNLFAAVSKLSRVRVEGSNLYHNDYWHHFCPMDYVA